MSIAAIMDQPGFPGELSETQQSRTVYALEDSKGGASSIWRSLMHLKLLLPYVSKLVPILEGNFPGALAPLPAGRVEKLELSEIHSAIEMVNRGLLDLQAGNREVRTQVQEQSTQLKRIDDQLLRLRESTQRNTMEHQELVEDLRTASTLVRGLSTVMIGLMVVVTAMVAFMLLHWRHWN